MRGALREVGRWKEAIVCGVRVCGIESAERSTRKQIMVITMVNELVLFEMWGC